MTQDNGPATELTCRIIGVAMRVHRRLGPGLLGSVYEKCLCYELHRADLPFRRQVPLDIHYDGVVLDSGLIAGIIVDGRVVLELKAIERILPLHMAQLMTCLCISRCRIGLPINFNSVSLTSGIRRRVI